MKNAILKKTIKNTHFKQKLKGFITGVICTLILTISIPSIANKLEENINVIFNKINLVVDGKKIDCDNFLYNNRTYVPLSTISNLLNADIEWYPETNTAEITNRLVCKMPN